VGRLPPEGGSGPQIAARQRALLGWFDRHRRALPWRETTDPYAIWVAEVMLQQTQVATVIPYYRRWMARFPDLASLADAAPEEVLRCWEGLGYYARARHLQAAARQVIAHHAGRLPADPAALARLAGIGPYTAGAIASIAFGLPVPAVDGNVRRVLMRLAAIEAATRSAEAERAVRARATELVQTPRPGDLNQALMELGATVCLARRPACGACPLAKGCAARRAGRQDELPRPARRRAPRTEHAQAYILRDATGRLLVARRPDRGLLGGLWEFPVLPADAGRPPPQALAAALAMDGRDLQTHEPIRHVFSHLRLVVTPVTGRAEGLPGAGEHHYDRWRRLLPEELGALPTSRLMAKLMPYSTRR
jgi:A/G-specific adenine glycosylase